MAQRRPYRPRGLRGSFPVEWLEARYLLSAAPSGWDVALIDRTLPQSRMLINAALGNTRVITYDGAHDSPQNVLDRVIQLSDAGGIRIASLSIFSHGAAGRFELGNDFITAGNSGETASQWMELRHVFAAGATLQIYGCDTADGISGRKLLNRLSQYTGATAFGSTNITGYGGDWVLEAHSNGLLNSVTVHAPLDVSELSGYRGQLVWIGATSGNTNDSSHDYNNTANWAGGTIDDSFSGVTFTGNTTLYFSANRTTGASGLNLNYSGAVDLTLMSNSSTARTLTLGGTGITGDFGGSSNSQTVTFGDATNAVNMNLNAGTQTFTVTGAGDSLVVPNVISNGTLTKAGSGTLQLSGTNTFSNTLTVSAGTLTQSGGSASPTTFSISSGATLNVNGGTLTITSSPTISGTLSIGGGTLSSSAGITNAGTINISSGTLQMTGTGPSGDYHNSGGATTNMTGGLLELGHDYAATTLNATGGTVEFQTSPGIANMKNGPYQFCNLQIDTGVTVPFNNAVLTVDIAGNFTNNGSATWGNSTAVFNGSGAQTIGGSSSTTFHNFTLNTSSATNTVTMASGLTTTVSATTTLTRGTLLVDGTFSPSANLTVPANVTVGGEGTITTSKSISVTGGSIAPGDPTGTLTTGPLTFSSGSPSYSVLLADSSGTITTDKQSVTGTATLGTSLTTLNLSFASGFSPLVGDQFTILSATTSRTGTFTNAATTITASGETFSVTYSATSVVLTYQSSSATTLAFGQQPANSTAGSAISPAVTVDVQDGFGNTKTSDSSTVTLTLSGGTFEGGTTTVTAAAANGVATFSNLKIDAAGTYRLTATDGSLTSAISSSFTVSAAAASAYRIAATSATPTAGASDQLTLTLVDQFGNTVTSFSGDKPLTFSGLSTSATGNVPTVTSKTGSATNEGTSELITFTNGVSSAGGTLVAYKAQSATLSVTDGTLTSASTGGTGVSLTVSAAAANAYRITAASTTPIAGAGDQLTLTLVDQYGNTVTSFSGDKTLTFSGLGTSTGGNVPTVTSKTGGAINEGTSELITFTNGVSSAGGSLIACKAETATLAVTDGTLGSGSTAGTGVSLTVSPAPVNSFGVTAPASATEGASFSFTVTALDPFGNTVTGYSGTVSFSSSDAQASLPGNHTFTTGAGNDNGVHTFSATLNTEGSKSITVTDGSSITGSVSISVGDAALTDASTSASVATNEGSSTGTLTVAQFSDANPGDHTADFSATIHWGDGNNSAGTVSYNSGTGTYSVTGSHTYTDEHATYAVTVDVADAGGSTLTGIGKMTVSVADVAPVVAVDQASVTVPENATATNTGTWSDYDDTVSLSASYGTVVKNINGTWSWSANGDESNSQTVTMTATNGDGATAVTSFRLTFTDVAPTVATPASATPNPVAGISTNLLVLGADDEGEGSLTYTWAASSKPAGSNPGFSINGSNAARDSTVTFDKAGSYTFQVTITNAGGLSVTSSISVTVNQTLTSIALSPPSATLNENATQQFAATAFDQFGAALATQPSFTWSIAGGIGSVDSSGLYTAPGSAGSATVRATSGSIHADALVTISNATPSVATAASATPNPVTGTTTGLRVLGADDGGEANLTYTWSLTGTPPASVDFSDNGTNSAKNSTATFSAAGTYDFLVTITDAGGLSTTSSLSVTVDQTQTDIAISPSSVTLNENETQQFTATAQDQFGDPMASQPSFTWSIASGIGSIDSSGLYTSPGSTGSATVHADSGGLSADAAVTVGNGIPTVATPASATPSPVTGTTTDLSVLGADDGGEPNLTYTWATTGTPPAAVLFSDNGDNSAKNCTATFVKAGTYHFQVTIADAQNQSVTSSVTVTVDQTFTAIVVSPASASLNENGTQHFTAVANDQFGNALLGQPAFTWSVASGIGSINSSGLYTAPGATGSAVVEATSSAINGTAGVTVNNGTPTVATAASATPNPVAGTTSALSVLGADDGGEANLTYTWSLSGTPPASVSFSDNATNSARNVTATFTKAGTYSFLVTITDAGGLSTTSSVSVTVNQTFNSIALTPASASLHENATQQFAATAYDQFGIALNVQPSFNWSSSGVGSVDASGLYSSAGTSGSATVTAANGAFTGSAIVTVNNAAPTIVTAASASPSPVNGTTTALSVLGADDGGEANLTYTWAATGTPPAPVIFSLTGNNAAKNSTVTFAKAGVYNFLVTVSDGVNATTSSVSVTVNQTLTSINVAPGSATVNENASQQFTATGIDQFGNAMTSQPSFAWSLTSGIGSIDATGQYTSPSAAGSATVQAVSGSVSGTASVTVNNASPTVSTPASATPSPVTGTTTALSALGADDGGEANLIYTWTTTGTPPAAVSFSANGTNAAKNSTATFTKAGTYNFLVTISDGSNSTTSGVSVVVNQTLTSIVVTPATVTLNGSGTQQFTANGLDQFANAMASQPAVTWSVASGVGSIDNAGFYTAPPSTGSATVRAASGAMSGTASITIDNAAPTVATPASATPNPVTGTFTALSVLGADDGGESNLTYTWVVAGTPPAAVTFSDNNTNSAKNATATFVKAGIYDLTVTIADSQGLTTTSSVTVTVDQTASILAISPASVGMNENGTQQFSAIAYDQFGDALQAQPTINWSIGSGIGSIDSSGLYTAPASAGTATIAASTGSVTGSASVTVSNGTPTIVTPASANPSPVIGTTTNLVVLGADDGGEANLIYTWATTGTPPAGVNFSANGTNAAKNSIAAFSKAGTYNFIVTISDGTLSVSSLVTVVVGQTVSAITVSPTSAAVIGGSSQQFTASATDQFGDSIPEPNFTWTLDTNSPGSLSAAALYTTQPADAGTAVVRATSAGISSTASVNVTTAVPEAPANLIAAAVLPTEVQLQWNDSSPALENGFRIERSADNVHWSAVGSVAAGTTSFTDSALQAQTIYFYRVFATSSAGADSAPSNVASVTTPQVILPPPPPPPPPSGLPIDNGGTGPTNGGSTGGTTGTSGDSTGPQTISNGPGTGGTNDSGSNPASGSTPTNANPAEDAAPTNTTAQNSPPSDAPKSDGSNAAPPAHPSDASNGTPRQGAVGNDPHSTPAGPNASHDNDRSNGGSKLMAARVSNDDADASRPLIAPADLQATVATADAYGALGSREQVQQEAATVAEREASHKKQQVTTSRVAATVTATAVAGYAIWLVQGGSLLLSAITTMPFWRWFDPLPVLDSWEKASAARRSKQAGRKQKNKGKQKDEERELDGIID